MAIRSKTDEYRYSHVDWDEDSAVTFKRYKRKSDSEAVANRAFEYRPQIDQRKMREARRRGEQYIPDVEQTTKESAFFALMEHMALRVEGPDWLIPEDYTAEDGSPHPLAGQQAPPTAEFFDAQEEHVLEDMEAHMDRVWAGQQVLDDETFRGRAESAPRSTKPAAKEARTPVPA